MAWGVFPWFPGFGTPSNADENNKINNVRSVYTPNAATNSGKEYDNHGFLNSMLGGDHGYHGLDEEAYRDARNNALALFGSSIMAGSLHGKWGDAFNQGLLAARNSYGSELKDFDELRRQREEDEIKRRMAAAQLENTAASTESIRGGEQRASTDWRQEQEQRSQALEMKPEDAAISDLVHQSLNEMLPDERSQLKRMMEHPVYNKQTGQPTWVDYLDTWSEHHGKGHIQRGLEELRAAGGVTPLDEYNQRDRIARENNAVQREGYHRQDLQNARFDRQNALDVHKEEMAAWNMKRDGILGRTADETKERLRAIDRINMNNLKPGEKFKPATYQDLEDEFNKRYPMPRLEDTYKRLGMTPPGGESAPAQGGHEEPPPAAPTTPGAPKKVLPPVSQHPTGTAAPAAAPAKPSKPTDTSGAKALVSKYRSSDSSRSLRTATSLDEAMPYLSDKERSRVKYWKSQGMSAGAILKAVKDSARAGIDVEDFLKDMWNGGELMGPGARRRK